MQNYVQSVFVYLNWAVYSDFKLNVDDKKKRLKQIYNIKLTSPTNIKGYQYR